MSSPIHTGNLPSRRLHSVADTGADIEKDTSTTFVAGRDWFMGGVATAAIVGGLAYGGKAIDAVSHGSEAAGEGIKAAAGAVVGGVEGGAEGIASVFTPDGKPKGLSVEKLENSKYQISITPTPAMAAKGPSELGELVDPGVYQGRHSNTTTEANLNYEIAKQHGGITPDGREVIKPGLKYQVPSLPEGLPDNSTSTH